MESSHGRTIIDPDGDFTLIVGTELENPREFLVSRKALTLACKTWKSMLEGGYRESSSNTVEFPDDDPDALQVLLSIAHLRFDNVPKEVTFELLFGLAILVDKYDLLRLVRPFWENWIKTRPKHDQTEKGHEEYLFIFWVFGMEKEFHAMALHLACVLKLSERNHALQGSIRTCSNEEPRPTAEYLLTLRLPDGIIDNILIARNTAVEALFALFTHPLAHSTPTVCQRANTACDSSITSSIIGTLTRHRIWPIPTTFLDSLYKLPLIAAHIEQDYHKQGLLQRQPWDGNCRECQWRTTSRAEKLCGKHHTRWNCLKQLQIEKKGYTVFREMKVEVGEGMVEGMRGRARELGAPVEGMGQILEPIPPPIRIPDPSSDQVLECRSRFLWK